MSKSERSGPSDTELLERCKRMTVGKNYEVIVLYVSHIEDGEHVTKQVRAVEFTSLVSGRRVFIGEAFVD